MTAELLCAEQEIVERDEPWTPSQLPFAIEIDWLADGPRLSVTPGASDMTPQESRRLAYALLFAAGAAERRRGAEGAHRLIDLR